METRRAESFSDGVFAVAITVLVFNLLPIADKSIPHFTELFRSNWPQYAAYVGSFVTIGIMWLNHHTMMSYLARVDRTLLVLNGLLLMGVVAVPFPTALIADSLGAHPNVNAKVAAVTYGVLLTAMSIAFASMWLYISAHGAKLCSQPVASSARSTIRFTGGLVAYVAGTVIGFVWPIVSVILYALIAVYYVFEHLPDASSTAAELPDSRENPDARFDP